MGNEISTICGCNFTEGKNQEQKFVKIKNKQTKKT